MGISYSQIIKSEGIKGTFSGFSATCLRDIPGWWTYFYSYSFLKQKFQTLSNVNDNYSYKSIFVNFMAGGFAGQISWIVSYPADIIKSYIQHSPQKHSISKAFLLMYRIHGFGFMTRGLTPWLVNGFIGNSVVFSLYEYSLQILNNMWGE